MESPAKRTLQTPPYPWKDDQKLVFLRIIVNWKATYGQTAAYKWPEIVSQFNSETQPPADKAILMNKLAAMKGEYTLWKRLVRSETGLGIDPDTGIIIADGLWWKRKISEKPGIKKFRDSGIPKEVEDMYMQIFDGSLATGEHPAMPGMGTQAADATPNEPIDEVGRERVGDSYFPLFNDEDGEDDGASPVGGRSHAALAARASPHLSLSRQGTPSGAQSKRRKSYAQAHEEATEHISVMRGHVDRFMAMATSYTPPTTVTSPMQVVEERGPTVEQALAEVHRLQIEEAIDGGKEFMGFAVTHVSNRDNRRAFMGCPIDFPEICLSRA